MFLKGILFTVF